MKLTKSHFIYLIVLCFPLFAQSCNHEKPVEKSLKEAFASNFLIGTALNQSQIEGTDKRSLEIVNKHFNSIVAENVMKSEEIQPKEGKFNFSIADKFIKYGEENHLHMVGHTLIWHSQAPKWFFTDAEGNDVSREVLIERMRNHIHTLVGRYKGKVHGWDVVNEAILDNGEWRQSKFYNIIGEEFVELAFKFAHEADPDAELYYNDYSMSEQGKREGVVKMVENLKSKGVRIDAIGMQGHISLEHPDLTEFEKSIVAFSNLGVNVMVTELDITVLPSPGRNIGADISANFELNAELNPYTAGLPDSIANSFNERYTQLFQLLLKHSDKISRVTLWGVHDGMSWRNFWPIRGRKDYPLLFDRDFKAKPVVNLLIEEAEKANKN